MKLQIAIDRVKLEDAVRLAQKLDGIADIIELGTSIIKDYGFYTIKKAKIGLNKSLLLMDSKTNDEGTYEFSQGFKAGADILTVMGSADKATLDLAYEVAEQKKKKMLIDLMGLEPKIIRKIAVYPNAIYNLHKSYDNKKSMPIINEIANFKSKYPNIKNIAVAGGINLKQVKQLAKQKKASIVIVGSKIVKTCNPVNSAIQFKEAIMHEYK